MNKKTYYIRYPGKYLGGRAIVRAINEQNAYDKLKEKYPTLDPFIKCTFEEIPITQDVIYNWDGDY